MEKSISERVIDAKQTQTEVVDPLSHSISSDMIRHENHDHIYLS